MKDYLQGWKNVKDVYIPPVKQKGFKENVIIRKYMPAKKVERIVMEMEEDDETVFVPMDEDYDDDRTVIVPEGIPGFVMIKRLKTGEIIKVAQDEFFIGKQVGNDYIIGNNPTISRRHARIFRQGDDFWLEDLNSSNHIYYEENRLEAPIKLTRGQQFRLSNDEYFEVLGGY